MLLGIPEDIGIKANLGRVNMLQVLMKVRYKVWQIYNIINFVKEIVLLFWVN